MKTIISIFALALTLLLNGCGQEADTTATEGQATQEAAPAQGMQDETATEAPAEDAMQSMGEEAAAAGEEAAVAGEEAAAAGEEAAAPAEGAESAMEKMEQKVEEATEQPATKSGN